MTPDPLKPGEMYKRPKSQPESLGGLAVFLVVFTVIAWGLFQGILLLLEWAHTP
jgi:hypothetical protein